MRKSLALLLVSAFAGTAFAADNASHTVTITVSAINEVEVVGGNVSLNISGGTSSGPAAASDDETASLLWSTNEDDKKITVETDLEAIDYPLSVSAMNVSGGMAAGAVTLSTTAQNFVTDISRTNGAAELAYTATADASSGTGVNAHTITYTITGE